MSAKKNSYALLDSRSALQQFFELDSLTNELTTRPPTSV